VTDEGDKRADFDARFRELRERFLERCKGDLTEIEAAAASPATMDRAAVRATVHRLAGAAGTFGFAKLSATAGVADDVLMVPDAAIGDELTRLIEDLKATLAAG
jgi:HPt (histidine-containing phosphotransfer) domain-containing protein